ncbi:MAG: hypothetical protein U1G07_11220 [Verrucomicrobiota bacterium]
MNPRLSFWMLLGFLAAVRTDGETAFRVVREMGQSTNLLRNAAFEESQGKALNGWSSAPQGMRLAPGEGRSGSVGLACEASEERGWYGASQMLALDRAAVAPLIVSGWSKAVDVTGGADSGYSLYVDLTYADGTTLWGRTAHFRTGTHDWERRELVILPEKPVRRLTLNCLLRGHAGKVWFDDLAVTEAAAPAGNIFFQGAPVSVAAVSGRGGTQVVSRSTGDGLKLDLAGGRVASLQVNGRELAGQAPSGFLARDVGANSDVHAFVDDHCPELSLQVQAKVTSFRNHLSVEGRVRDTSGRDRAILLGFALPIQAHGWTWSDDIRQTRPITGTSEFADVVTVNAGSTGTQSTYPLAAIHDDRSGLALAIDMGSPAQFRLVYHAGTRQFLILYDFGLVQETKRFPSAADFRFVLYAFDPQWGFRAAFQKLTEIFPEYFEVRSRDQGIWMPFTAVSRVEGWADFGFRYHEGSNSLRFDDEHGILSFRYTEPMTWWMKMAPEVPRQEANALRIRDEYAASGRGNERQMAEATRVAAMHDGEGRPALIFRNEPWANGAVWSLNPNPWLPAEPNAATVHWNPTIREALYGPEAKGTLDGEYLDSLEGYVTAELNFRREHFIHTTVPLTFDSGTHQPALAKGLAVFEFTRWISEDLHRLHKLCFANGVPYRFGFLCPWLDVLGTETDWLSGGVYRPVSHRQLALWRTLSGGKPYLLLMNTDYDRLGSELVERYFARSLFYGMFPSMFSHNASENPYWQNPKWYNRDRPIFRRFLPVIKEVAEAGWQPVTRATCDHPQLLVERFGTDASGAGRYYTVFNDTDLPQRGLLRETPVPVPHERVATELLTGRVLASSDGGWQIELPAQTTAAIRIQPAGTRP